MLPDIQPGNTKILYFFNCLLDGMHTMILEKRYIKFLWKKSGKVLKILKRGIIITLTR